MPVPVRDFRPPNPLPNIMQRCSEEKGMQARGLVSHEGIQYHSHTAVRAMSHTKDTPLGPGTSVDHQEPGAPISGRDHK